VFENGMDAEAEACPIAVSKQAVSKQMAASAWKVRGRKIILQILICWLGEDVFKNAKVVSFCKAVDDTTFF